jgi:hypothetical protein
MLMEDVVNDSEATKSQLKLLQKVDVSVKFLHQMVDGLLNLSQTDNMEILEKTPFTIDSL